MRKSDLQGKGGREEMEVWKRCNYIKISKNYFKNSIFILSLWNNWDQLSFMMFAKFILVMPADMVIKYFKQKKMSKSSIFLGRTQYQVPLWKTT